MGVFIIAEAGANHNKNFKQAISLIDVAVESGADAVKFQTYSSETLYSKNTPNFAGYKNINKLIQEIELPRQWQPELKNYCDEVGIEFMSTPFDEAAVEDLVSLGVKRLKIAGFESTDPRFVRMVASTGLPLIISAGIGNSSNSIQSILDWVSLENPTPDITILHCNNAYPTPNKDIFLNEIDTIKRKYPEIKVGLSDHTEGTLAPVIAVAKGATCIEKHYTISRRLPGPDHSFALEPAQLKAMVEGVRIAETMCKDKTGALSDSEREFSKAMRSVVVRKDIKKGEKFTEDNLTTKRPFLEGNVHSSEYYQILGTFAAKDYKEDDFFKRGAK